MATSPVLTQFSWVSQAFSPQRRVHSVVYMGGVVKTLTRSNSLSRSIFSTAGSFGCRRATRKKKMEQPFPALELLAKISGHFWLDLIALAGLEADRL